MALKQLAQRRARRQLTGCNDQLCIAGLPILQGGVNSFGNGVSGVFQKNHAWTGKETLRLESILQYCRVFAQHSSRQS